MNRRKLLVASSAFTALAVMPRALAEWEPSQRYPDPLVKIIDPTRWNENLDSRLDGKSSAIS
jgi:hypothetical protein